MQLFIIAAFLAGLAGSVHCVGMCGPLALSLPFSRFNASLKWIAIILYNLGRVVAYSSIGLLVGLVGRGINWFGFTQILSIILGALILISLLLPKIMNKSSFYLPNWLNKYTINTLQVLIKKQSIGWMFFVGLMNGFLPCGLVYMAVAAAVVAGTISNAILFMFFFGLGTIPAMIILIVAAQKLSPIKKGALQKMIPIVTLLIGIILILRGLNLDIPFISPYLSQNLSGATAVECHIP